MVFDCIVVASHLRYDGVWQRPHHLVSRFARRVPVLFVEEPFFAKRDADTIERGPEVDVLRPQRKARPATMFDAATLAAVRRWVGERRPLLWLYTPQALPIAGAFPRAPLVYDRMDDLSAFAFAAPGLAEREERLLESAGLVFTGGRSLFERARRFGPKVRLYPSGVDFEHFARAQQIAPHPLFANLLAPVCGYAGVIDERFDFAAIQALALRPVEIVLVGPVMKIDTALLPRRSNVHFTGQVEYGELPAFYAGFDVALVPFARNAATASISPTKTPEYLAARKPVVSTPIADVVADPETFAQACLFALAPDAGRTERGVALARAAGWDDIAARMWNDLGRE
jgi:UDP-galactopyranose mutase